MVSAGRSLKTIVWSPLSRLRRAARVTSAPERKTVTESTREVAGTSSAAAFPANTGPARRLAKTPTIAIEVRIVFPLTLL